jgi:hypothetical protein
VLEQNPSSTILPRALPVSSSACARLRFAALMVPKCSATVERILPASTSPISDELAREALVHWRELVADGRASADGNPLYWEGGGGRAHLQMPAPPRGAGRRRDPDHYAPTALQARSGGRCRPMTLRPQEGLPAPIHATTIDGKMSSVVMASTGMDSSDSKEVSQFEQYHR